MISTMLYKIQIAFIADFVECQ